MKMHDQDATWQKVKYRGPDDFVARSYVLPKIQLIESVMPLDGLSVLDVGCGPALFSGHLQARARRVVGTDISRVMLQRARGLEVVLADALHLPFANESFDLVFSANLLHHTDFPDEVLMEMARIARKAVVIIEPNRNNPLMFVSCLLMSHEHGALRSSRSYLEGLFRRAALMPERFWTTGMITQNKTPEFLVPLLKLFDFDFPLGQYHVVVAVKRNPSD